MDGQVKIETIDIDVDEPTIWYDIDFNRVRDIGDIINILKGMKLGFTEKYLELNPSLKAYVKLRKSE